MMNHKMLISRHFYKIAFLLLIVGSCGNNEENTVTAFSFDWKRLGLDGTKVNQLVLKDATLYAATENGVYSKNIASDQLFQEIGLQGKNVEAILVLAGNEILASVIDFQADIEIEIYRRSNIGDSWNVMESDFGRSFEPAGLWAFHQHPTQTDIIYATGNYLVAKSIDKGVSWEPIFGDWDQFARATSVVTVNPIKDDEIWLGGQGGIEDGYLVRLKNEIEVNRWLDLVDNPTTVKKIVFDNENPQNIYVGFEGALLRTSDNGESWLTLINEVMTSRFFNGIALSNINNDLVFAGGWLKGGEPQPLILYYSADKGVTWKEETLTEEEYGGIEDMLLITEGDQERIFVALDKGGVYEVSYSAP